MNVSILNLMLGVVKTVLKKELTHWKHLNQNNASSEFCRGNANVYYNTFWKVLFNKLDYKQYSTFFTTHIRTEDFIFSCWSYCS